MLIVLATDVTPEAQKAIEDRVRELGFTPHAIEGAGRTAIGITGNKGPVDPGHFRLMEGVADCIPVTAPYKLVSREVKHDDTIVDVAGIPIGGREIVVMAGPCAVESEQQILAAARGVRKSGASLLRGGAFKPRTSPYDFQGLRQKGLALLEKARGETGLKVVTEVKDTETLPLVAESADLLQIGARNMQNFSLLEAVGDLRKPVLLKRGMSSTIKELLMAAEYIVSRGNKQVILCERGIRTFETMTRNTLDLNAVPMLKSHSHLPVVVDPSHGIGIRSAVLPMARAAVAAGADGLIIEVHPDPDRALSDGMQSLDLPHFETLMRELEKIAGAVGRSLHRIAEERALPATGGGRGPEHPEEERALPATGGGRRPEYTE